MRTLNRELALESRRILNNALGGELPCPDSMVAFLAAVPIPDGAAKEPDSPLYTDPLQDELFHRYQVEVPIVPWPAPPKRLVRTSSQLYNSPAQSHFLAAALKEALSA